MSQGRPTTFTEELASMICELIATGESLRSICKDEEMPAISTVMLWAAKDRRAVKDGVESPYPGFSEQYDYACEARLLYNADELLDIADDATNDWMEKHDPEGECTGYQLNGEHVNRSKLRIETRKWLLSKLLPKFADKQQIDHTSNGKTIKTFADLYGGTAKPESD